MATDFGFESVSSSEAFAFQPTTFSFLFSQIPSTVERLGPDGSNRGSLLPGDEEEQLRLALQLSQRADEEERQRRQREEEELEMILALSLTEK